MELKPFSFEDAEEICEDFVDMTDTELMFDGKEYMVEAVVICPFDVAEKDAFFTNYKVGDGNFNGSQEADEVGFDVTLVVTDLEKEGEGLFFIGIRQYIAEKGVNYNFP